MDLILLKDDSICEKRESVELSASTSILCLFVEHFGPALGCPLSDRTIFTRSAFRLSNVGSSSLAYTFAVRVQESGCCKSFSRAQ
jgi:hypothetical protein